MADQNTVPDELLRKCERILWRTLPSVMHANRRIAQEEFDDDLQLTPAQFHMLRNIHRGAKSVSDLAACEKVTLPAISRHVDDLANLGLVERTRDPEDRRSLILALTEKGQEIWNRMVERNHQAFSEKMKLLSPQEIETIITGLELLYSAFSNEAAECKCEVKEGEQHA